MDFRRCPLYQDLASGIIPAGIEAYLPLFFEETSNLFDYLPADAQVFSLVGVDSAAETFWLDIRSRYAERCGDIERPVIAAG